MQALLPSEFLFALGEWNSISSTTRCASMRAASHWTWFALLTALSRKARLAQHDVPESGGMLPHAKLFAQIAALYEVYIALIHTYYVLDSHSCLLQIKRGWDNS
jgi:hypothetical protein